MRSTLGVMTSVGVQTLRSQQSSGIGGHLTGSQHGFGGHTGLHLDLHTGFGAHLGFGLQTRSGLHSGLHTGLSSHDGLHDVCSTDSANAPVELHNVTTAQIAKILDVILTSIRLLQKRIKIQSSE